MHDRHKQVLAEVSGPSPVYCADAGGSFQSKNKMILLTQVTYLGETNILMPKYRFTFT